MTNSTPADLAAQWQALVVAESKRAGHALLGLLHAKQKNPELWAAVNGSQRSEHRQMELQFEQQEVQRMERQG